MPQVPHELPVPKELDPATQTPADASL
jgi:hypothetical protein